MVMILTVPLGTAYTDHLTRPGWKFLNNPPARRDPLMTHANAPLTPTGRLRMVHRHLHDGIP
ncbi:hypothetical protein E4T95_11740, partial [Micrococcus yunnanensis]